MSETLSKPSNVLDARLLFVGHLGRELERGGRIAGLEITDEVRAETDVVNADEALQIVELIDVAWRLSLWEERAPFPHGERPCCSMS